MFLLIFFLNLALAKTPLSTVRAPHEDYRNFLRGAAEPSDPYSDTALSVNEDIANRPWLKMVESTIDPIIMQALFEDLRDFQPLKDQENHPRRLTWLYPDDGCYARSAIAQQQLKMRNRGNFQQIFVFGNLVAETNNHPSGQVSWWYHVVPIVRTSFGFFVFDPAIEATHPLLIDQWLDRILPDKTDARVSVCAPSTYSPEHICQSEEPIETEKATQEETDVYLDLEWTRLRDLGRDPEKELGAEPPWTFFPYKLINQ